MCSCVNSIDKIDEIVDVYKGNDYPFCSHFLLLRIQDTSGNDLVKGIRYNTNGATEIVPEERYLGIVESDLYTLNIIYPNLCNDVYYLHYKDASEYYIPDAFFPTLHLQKIDGNYFLELSTKSYIKDCSAAEKLTFKLKCHYLFGDDAEHDIVTYWKPDTEYNGIGIHAHLCYRIELDGKEFEEITYESYNQVSKAMVILDR